MSRGASKHGRTLEVHSFPLEDYFPINYFVVGSQQWFDTSFDEGAVDDGQKIVIRTKQDLVPIVDWLLEQLKLGVDSETGGEDKESGLNPLLPTSRMLLFQIGTRNRVYLIEPGLAQHFKEVLESRLILHLLQNANFDFKFFLVKYGVHLGAMWDTMLAEQLLTSGLSGLKVGMPDLCRRYKPYLFISKETRRDFIDFKACGYKFSRKMLYYAARDVVVLFDIHEAQVPEVARWKLEVVAQDEFNCIPVTAMMEIGGVFIDPVVLRKALTYWISRQEFLEREILRVYDEELLKKGRKPLTILPDIQEVFDLNSQAQKLAALKELGYKIDDVKRDTLELYPEDPIMRMLAEYSNVTKITSTYGENMISRINPVTHRLHPEFHQLGSGDMEERMGRAKKGTIATGRYSSDFQQLPRKEERFVAITDQAEIQKVLAHFNRQLAMMPAAA